MTRLKERVIELLHSRAGEDVCVGCIARALGVPHKSAHEAMLKLEAQSGFRRRYGRCVACDKTRIVTGYTLAAIPALPLDDRGSS
jgi:hypothetical protein